MIKIKNKQNGPLDLQVAFKNNHFKINETPGLIARLDAVATIELLQIPFLVLNLLITGIEVGVPKVHTTNTLHRRPRMNLKDELFCNNSRSHPGNYLYVFGKCITILFLNFGKKIKTICLYKL